MRKFVVDKSTDMIFVEEMYSNFAVSMSYNFNNQD